MRRGWGGLREDAHVLFHRSIESNHFPSPPLPLLSNLVVLPGYCVSGTVGAKLMAGPVSRVDVDKRTTVDVRCGVRYLSFSAHADARGICDLVRAAADGPALLGPAGVRGVRHGDGD